MTLNNAETLLAFHCIMYEIYTPHIMKKNSGCFHMLKDCSTWNYNKIIYYMTLFWKQRETVVSEGSIQKMILNS